MITLPNYRPSLLPLVRDADPLMIIPMTILGLGAVVFGYLSQEFYLSQGQLTGDILVT
jgi:hypothetical protein